VPATISPATKKGCEGGPFCPKEEQDSVKQPRTTKL
jgi:hypothetical protein